MKAEGTYRCGEPEHALAVAAYRSEQKRMRRLLQEALGKYGKPKMTLEELRDLLGAEMGDASLSGEIINMREEGY